MPVDATGAGDAFMAGLIVSLFRLGDTPDGIFAALPNALQHALAFANACGAYATTQLGATAHNLSEEVIREMMQG